MSAILWPAEIFRDCVLFVC